MHGPKVPGWQVGQPEATGSLVGALDGWAEGGTVGGALLQLFVLVGQVPSGLGAQQIDETGSLQEPKVPPKQSVHSP